MVASGKGVGGGMEGEIRVSRCKLLYVGCIDKILLYSTENYYIPCPVINRNGKEYIYIKKDMYIYLNHFAAQQQLTHCKSAVYIFRSIYMSESLGCTVEINTL